MPFALTPERDRELEEILTRYPNKMAACIPALHLCQDQHGWVSDEIVDFVSKKLALPTSHVKGVVTFYTLFNQHPVGKHQVWVCRTLPCALRGAGDVLAQCEKKLGIKTGETTKDGKVTLRTAECLASCGTAPMMQVDRDYHENLSKEDVDKILDGLLKGKPIAPKLVPAMPAIERAPLPAPLPPPAPIAGAIPEKKSAIASTMMGTAPPANAPATEAKPAQGTQGTHGTHGTKVPMTTMLGTAPPANAPVTEKKAPSESGDTKAESEKPAATMSEKPAPAISEKPKPLPPPPAIGIAGAGSNVGAGAKEKDPLKGTMLGLGIKGPPPPLTSPVSGSVKPPGGSVPPPPLPNRASTKPPPVPPKPLSVPPKPLDDDDALNEEEEEKTKKGES
jgi:NADH-quinone oxidoreductase subunit E